MSPLVTRPAPPAAQLRVERVERNLAREEIHARTWLEGTIVFGLAFALYGAFGLWLTLGLDIVLVDAQSRLENAFQIWWNDPGKLASIGFYWPPIQTLVIAPFAIVKPLATSMAALPLMSALFGAGLLTVLDRLLATVGLDRPLRWLLVALFGLNPMIFFYSTNGMAEIVYLFFLTLAISLYVRWSLDPKWHYLPIAGLVFGVGVLTRYEVGLWLPLVAVGVVATLVARRQSVVSIESALLSIVVPALYALTAWSFLNLELTGDAFGWFTILFPKEGGTARDVSGIGDLVTSVFGVHLGLFFPSLVLGLVLLALALRWRETTPLVLGGALLVNLLSTLYLVGRSGQGFLLEPRYNMRAMPIAVVAVAWLVTRAPSRFRRPIGVVAVALAAVSIPLTAATMADPTYAVGESAFIHGLLTGESQDGLPTPRGTGISRADQRDMAAYARAHVPGRNQILTDDAQTFGVQLTDGDPSRYVDRVDRGDTAWLRLLARPRGRVGYLLVNRDRFRPDLVARHYPRLRSGTSLPEFVRLAHANPTYALYRVLPRRKG